MSLEEYSFMIKRMAVLGSGLFLTSIEELTINDWYIILLCLALGITILKAVIQFFSWLNKKIQEAKADDGRVSREERKAIYKAAKEYVKEQIVEIKSDTKLAKEKIEQKLTARSNTNGEQLANPVPIDKE